LREKADVNISDDDDDLSEKEEGQIEIPKDVVNSVEDLI
jgi:hypothetical protein